jgi:Predicted permease
MEGQDLQLRIPFATLLKVAFALLLAIIVVRLWPVLVMVFVAALIAAVLNPLARWLEGRGVRRPLVVTLISLSLLGILLLVFMVLIPAISRQVVEISKDLPNLEKQVVSRFPFARPLVAQLQSAKRPTGPQMRDWMTRGLAVGRYAIEGITTLIFILVLAVYLLIEGDTAAEWLISFAPKGQRGRFERLKRELGGVMLAYMRGQLITCILCGAWAYGVLLLLRVPGALPLAAVAFLLDLVPVLGTIAMTVPAVLLALTVSPLCAALVVVAYLFYHFAESYFIVPRVYGKQMRLSTLTVLLAIAVGGTLQGIVGAILILPLVAAYPIVERIFLREELPSDTVERHEEMAEGEAKS